MTVFAAIKSAVLRAEGTQIQEAFASSAQVAVEMSDLVNEVAADIVADSDWRALTKVATITATGATAYDLPSDYGRMLLGSEVDDPGSIFWGYEPFASVNDWMRYVNGEYTLVAPGGWIIVGGQIQFQPSPTGSATFPYISTEWARAADGTAKTAFTADDDTFILSERLLTLGLIWRWKEQKGLEYAEDLATYGKVLGQESTRDRGAFVLRPPRPVTGGASIAYSGRPIR